MIFTDAILAAHAENLTENKRALILGLGVNYPNGADGTTKGLAAKFPDQVFDTPVSELSFTGMGVGLASQGFRPIVHHGRVEFAMLAFDQIFTQAARWNYMFGGGYPCPVGFRICIGRQWGNGPQHTANYHSMFLQSPGLNVAIPATPGDAYAHIRFMNRSDSPTVMLEHRWLYKTLQKFEVGRQDRDIPARATLYGTGEGGLIVSYGDGVIEALRAMDLLRLSGVEFRVLALKFFPEEDRISDSLTSLISEYREVLFVDTAPFNFGLLAGIAGSVMAGNRGNVPKIRVFSPNCVPCPTSPILAGDYYPTAPRIANLILTEHGVKDIVLPGYNFDEIHLAPTFDFDRYNSCDIS